MVRPVDERYGSTTLTTLKTHTSVSEVAVAELSIVVTLRTKGRMPSKQDGVERVEIAFSWSIIV